MNSVIEWFKDKKMYATAIAVAVIAGLTALGIEIPEWVYILLSAFGIAATKAAIAKSGPAA